MDSNHIVELQQEIVRLQKQLKANKKNGRLGIRIAEAKWASTDKLLNAAKAERDVALDEIKQLQERLRFFTEPLAHDG